MRFLMALAVVAFGFASTDLAYSAQTVKLRNTYYYVVLESLYAAEPADTPVRDVAGDLIAMVSKRFKRATDIEGTGRLMDGRVINYAARINGEIRYLVAKTHWGYGVGNCALRPFGTVAIDPRVIPLGSLVYIRETRGMPLPDGTEHDGYWRAEDVGGAIKKDRIDLFVGDGDRGDVLVAHGITHLKPLTVKVVQAPPEKGCVNDRPGLE